MQPDDQAEPAISDNEEQPQEAISDSKDFISEAQDVPVESHLTDEQVKRDKPEPKPPVVDTPPVAPKPSQVVTEQPVLQDKQPTPAPKIEQKSQSTENQIERDKLTPEQKAMQLTEEELDAARKLWARKHIATAQKKSNESRHARMVERMNEIEKLVKAEPNTTVHELANKMNLSEKLTSGYLQKLVKAGRIKASGNTNSRRYS